MLRHVRNKFNCSNAHALESSEFSTIWLRLKRSDKAEVPLAFRLWQLSGGPEEVSFLIFPGIITISVSETHLSVLNA
ncbi:hypothetical protein E2C01_020518 [Portunus trituberculatus]|uniref:Uncharacterized protein n=1 Tax=Portunus trituberculatus TaxID=210409 RepID=A0A5B7E1Q4_PORTR|nr:hypothetical protein [Portunus trituberculatus]